MQEEIDHPADQEREDRDKEEHEQGCFRPPLLDDHEEARQTGDEERQRNDAHDNLVGREEPLFRECKETRGPVVPPEEP